jgi:hypothetical protein
MFPKSIRSIAVQENLWPNASKRELPRCEKGDKNQIEIPEIESWIRHLWKEERFQEHSHSTTVREIVFRVGYYRHSPY